MRLNDKRESEQLSYGLATFPYRRFMSLIDCKFWERGLEIHRVDVRKTSITCPIYGYANEGSKTSGEAFKCRR